MNLLLLGEEYIGDNICSKTEVLSVLRMFGYVILIARLIIPILIIVMGSLDFYKVVTDGNEDTLTKQAKKFAIRLCIGILVFFIPTLVDLILGSLIDQDAISKEIETCQTCLLKPTQCNGETIKSTIPKVKDLYVKTNKECNKYKKKVKCENNDCKWSTDKKCVAYKVNEVCSGLSKTKCEHTSGCQYINSKCRLMCNTLSENNCNKLDYCKYDNSLGCLTKK